MGKRLVFLYN